MNNKNIGTYTKKEINFLKKNYPIHGSKFCQNELNRGVISIQNKVRVLGIKKNKNASSLIPIFWQCNCRHSYT